MKRQTILLIRYPGTKLKSLIFKKADEYDHNFKYTDDNFYVEKYGIDFEINFIYFKLFRDELIKLFESGIVKAREQKLFSNKEYKKKFEIVEKEKEIEVLSIDSLRAGFVIWIVTVLASIVVFVYEMLHFKMTNKQNNSKIGENEKNENSKTTEFSRKVPKISRRVSLVNFDKPHVFLKLRSQSCPVIPFRFEVETLCETHHVGEIYSIHCKTFENDIELIQL